MNVYVLSVECVGQTGVIEQRTLGVYVALANAQAAGEMWSKQIGLDWSVYSGAKENAFSGQFLRDDTICVLGIHSFKLESVGLK